VTRDSSGSATVWALLAVVLIWTMAAVGAAEIAAVQTRHRADAAADAAALAAAGEGGLDPDAACADAREAAARVGADLVRCTLSGPYATVTVRMVPPSSLRWLGPVSARARAGPADTGKPDYFRTMPTAS